MKATAGAKKQKPIRFDEDFSRYKIVAFVYTQYNLQMFNRETKIGCKTVKNADRERCQHVSGLGALGEQREPQSEFSHGFEDEFQGPEILDKDALYKVPGCLAPPGESHKCIKDKCVRVRVRVRARMRVRVRFCELALPFDIIL